MQTRPYYRRSKPSPQNVFDFAPDRIDLRAVYLPPYPAPDIQDAKPRANKLFDGRAAAAVRCGVGIINAKYSDFALLEFKGGASFSFYILTQQCLPVMAFPEYFSQVPLRDLIKGFDTVSTRAIAEKLGLSIPFSLRALFFAYMRRLRDDVSGAIGVASPGWCGTFNPDATGALSLENHEGNYDITQMFILPLAYRYYSDLTPDAQEKLIRILLQKGCMHRPTDEDDTFTSGQVPDDWWRAALITPVGVDVSIPETENHVLMIATARYLTNQLLYQRTHDYNNDNRRNGKPGKNPGCLEQLLLLLRDYLCDDFVEYNAKPYQEETRYALLNLCSYAYDAEVRLGARMVLDYISAHIAVSSNDLRRMVPFRRRNEHQNVNVFQTAGEHCQVMDIGLLDRNDHTGADPMPAHFALLTGSTRAYQRPNDRPWSGKPERPWDWAITPNYSADLTLEAISDYRIPPSIHDLFVNDSHRRFFQRIHRRSFANLPLFDPSHQRNCDNMEIYAGSPSYLISAGGKPAQNAIPGVLNWGWVKENIGVAVPTSFIPTGTSARNNSVVTELAKSVGMSERPVSVQALARALGISVPFELSRLFAKQSLYPGTDDTRDLIQISLFSDGFECHGAACWPGFDDLSGVTLNYGVAPDFACGVTYHFPAWTGVPNDEDGIFFIDKKARSRDRPGFFLAVIKEGLFVVLEAFDTWLNQDVTFKQFYDHVLEKNGGLKFENGREHVYTTYNGNIIRFLIWSPSSPNNPNIDNHLLGAKILHIEYAPGNPRDTLVGAGNYDDEAQFLRGTVLNSTGDVKIEINNRHLDTKITLDWTDPSHLMRISEDGEVEHAGKNAAGQPYEVWVDFDWSGPVEGDFFCPFNRLATAVDAVADGGVIKIAPGTSRERFSIRSAKRIKLVAPVGDVTLGAR